MEQQVISLSMRRSMQGHSAIFKKLKVCMNIHHTVYDYGNNASTLTRQVSQVWAMHLLTIGNLNYHCYNN